MHIDIKPQNILLKFDNDQQNKEDCEEDVKGRCILADFGCSRIVNTASEQMIAQTEGTFHFFPPEGCDPDVKKVDGFKADVWALGVTLFCLIYGTVPFDGQNEYWVMENIRVKPVELPQTSERTTDVEAEL